MKPVDQNRLEINMFRATICFITVAAVLGAYNGETTFLCGLMCSIFFSFLETEPNWLGSFNVSPLCDPKVCCCLTGEVKVVQFAHFFMKISGQLTGQCKGLSSFFLPSMKPSTFSITLPIFGKLKSDDSSTITAHSPLGPQCNGRAVRRQQAPHQQHEMEEHRRIF